MCERVEGKIGAIETPIGYMPRLEDFDRTGLQLPDEDLEELLEVDIDAFKSDMADAEAFLARFGAKVPARLRTQLKSQMARLG
jgi:phosphoenolpyruvate carboxykinase (GTP)